MVYAVATGLVESMFMTSAEWIDLIQRFPPSDFDGFGIIMEGGLEISLQTVLQLNSDHMLIRGRTVGSTDAGRYFYLPYNKMNCICYNRPKKEEEVLSWYDGGMPTAAPPPAAAEEAPIEEAPEEEEAASEPAPAATPTKTTTVRPAARPSGPIRPAAAPVRPAAAPGGRPVAAEQQASGLQTSALANVSQNNPIKTALLERLRARRQGQDPPPPEKK